MWKTLKILRGEVNKVGRKWTEKEKKYVKENWGGGISTKDMAAKLNRTEAAVKEKARILRNDPKKKARGDVPRKELSPREKCRTCIYRARQGRGCDHADLTGKLRRCPADQCDKYTKGQRIKRQNEPAWARMEDYDV